MPGCLERSKLPASNSCFMVLAAASVLLDSTFLFCGDFVVPCLHTGCNDEYILPPLASLTFVLTVCLSQAASSITKLSDNCISHYFNCPAFFRCLNSCTAGMHGKGRKLCQCGFSERTVGIVADGYQLCLPPPALLLEYSMAAAPWGMFPLCCVGERLRWAENL